MSLERAGGKKKKRPTSNNNNKQIKGEQQEDTHAERVNARTTRIQNGGKNVSNLTLSFNFHSDF